MGQPFVIHVNVLHERLKRTFTPELGHRMAVEVVRAILWHGNGRFKLNIGHRMALRVSAAILWSAAEIEMPDQVEHRD